MTLSNRCYRAIWAFLLGAAFATAPLGMAQFPAQQPEPKSYPWSDSSLSPDVRADLVIKELTLEEKISLLHGQGGFGANSGPTASNGGAGWSNAIPRVGIPAIQMADSAYGVTRGAASGRYSTALPSNLGQPQHGIRKLPLNMAR